MKLEQAIEVETHSYLLADLARATSLIASSSSLSNRQECLLLTESMMTLQMMLIQKTLVLLDS
ncbi:MAG: hypothetical protein K2X63_00110 [Burkholderiaceae bacterium]|nr:hypothetical protein [Burkholderiaceae bacterium]